MLQIAQMQPKCRPNMAQRLQILQPEMNPWKFSVVQARPESKPQAQNPTRTMKKVARPSPIYQLTQQPTLQSSKVQNCQH